MSATLIGCLKHENGCVRTDPGCHKHAWHTAQRPPIRTHQMFGFFKSKSKPTDLSKLTREDIKAMLAAKEPGVPDLCKRAAEAGSVDAALFLSTASLVVMERGKANEGVRAQYVKYTEIAAKLGDSGSRFNMAKHHFSLSTDENQEMNPEGYKHLKRAEYWYRLAAKDGFGPAIESLENIAPVLAWADKTFGGTNVPAIAPAQHQKQQTSLEKLISNAGWETAVSVTANEVIARIPNQDVAYQWLLQELDGASQGNDYAKQYVEESFIAAQEYAGALKRDNPAVDGEGGPQQFILEASLLLIRDREQMARFRCDVGRKVQDHFSIGRSASF